MNLLDIRKDLRLGQRDFCKIIGLSEDDLRKIESGKMKAPRSCLKAVEYYLKLKEKRDVLNLVISKRRENKIDLVNFCEMLGVDYKLWEKLERN